MPSHSLPDLFTDHLDANGEPLVHPDYPLSAWKEAFPCEQNAPAYLNWVHDQEIEKNAPLKP